MAPVSFTPEEFFVHSRPEGVTRAVLIQMNFYEFDNRYMLDCMEKYTGVFSGVAIVDETKGDVVESMKSLAEKGVRGFRIYTDLENAIKWRDSKGMNAMWSHAADSGLSMCLLSNPDALPLVNEMCKRYPKTRVVIDHFSRIGVTGTIPASQLDDLCRLSEYKNVYVKTSAFYALGQKKPPYIDLGGMIQRLLQVFSENRLMWASDCPYQVADEHSYSESIALIRDKLPALTESNKQWILKGTAEKVFFT